MPRAVVVDACCVLNLLATGRELDVLRACDVELIISEQAHGEALFLHTPPDVDGVRSKQPASTERLRAAGRLQIWSLETEPLIAAFVACAAQLRDEDASCVALAGVLGVPLLSDDGKERRIAREQYPGIALLSTLGVLHEAMRLLATPEHELLALVTDLRWRGNFAPPRKDPLSPWYAELLRRAGVPW
jgi:predicted nucleic acid-binding protein